MLNVWRALAITLMAMLFVLGGGFLFQAGSLHWDWHPQYGTVAEWIAALGSVAALSAVWIAVQEWRAGQVSRREAEGDQARLLVVEQVDREDDPEAEPDMLVYNRSAAPFYNVLITSASTTARLCELRNGHEVNVALIPALAPDKCSPRLRLRVKHGLTPNIHYVVSRFTDAHGRDWTRTGSGPPERWSGRRPWKLF